LEVVAGTQEVPFVITSAHGGTDFCLCQQRGAALAGRESVLAYMPEIVGGERLAGERGGDIPARGVAAINCFRREEATRRQINPLNRIDPGPSGVGLDFGSLGS